MRDPEGLVSMMETNSYTKQAILSGGWAFSQSAKDLMIPWSTAGPLGRGVLTSWFAGMVPVWACCPCSRY